MSDYKELVEELRDADQSNWKRLSLDAAAAIESLQAEAKKWESCTHNEQKEAFKYLQRCRELEAELEPKRGEMVEVVRCKDCYWKRVEHFGNGKEYYDCSRGNSRMNNGEWYCPEGEKFEVQE